MIAAKESQQNDRLSIDEVTFAIPTQSFNISCAISAEESLPVVTEFALRIIYVCRSMSPEQLQNFFGYSEKETRAVVKALLDERLVQWHEEQLELTSYASLRFQDSSDNLPRFFKIQDWSAEVLFELISFSPVERAGRMRRSRSMVELSPDPGKESNTIQWAEQSFQKHFSKICNKDRAEIYKITDIDPGERFVIPLPCVFNLNLDSRIEIRRQIDDESFGERLEIARAISDAISNQDARDNDNFENFVEIFDDNILRSFISKNTFDLRSYVQEVHLYGKTTYQNGKVVPVLGSLHLARNEKMLLEWVKAWTESDDGVDANPVTLSACWLAPSSRLWSRSSAARELVKKIDRGLVHGDPATDEEQKSGGVCALFQMGKGSSAELYYTYRDTFSKLYGTSAQLLGGNIEIFLLPQRFVCALFHFHQDHPISIPIGFISSDPVHLAAATDLIQRRIVERHGIASLHNTSRQDGADIRKEFEFLGQGGAT